MDPTSLDEMNIKAQSAVIRQLDSDEKLVLSAKVIKINKKNLKQTRTFILTNKSIYHFEGKNFKKRILIQHVSGMTLSDGSKEFIIHVDKDNDYHYIYPIPNILNDAKTGVLSREKIGEKLNEACAQTYPGKIIPIAHESSPSLEKSVLRKSAKEKRVKNAGVDHKYSSENKENQLSLDDFGLVKLLGKGAFGTVLLVKKKDNEELLALKCVSIERCRLQYIETEEIILKQLNFAFLVKMKYHFYSNGKAYFAMQFMKGGDLSQYLRVDKIFSEERTKFYAAQIVLGLEYLHKHNIIYRDMKPENILMDEHGYIYLSDFGISKILKEDEYASSLCGTPEYMAPEVIGRGGHKKEADWWGLGVLVYELLFGKMPFAAQTSEKTFEMILKSNLYFPKDIQVSPEAHDFITRCLQKDPKQRLGSKDNSSEIKRHPWFSNTDWTTLLNKQIVPFFRPIIKSETASDYCSEQSIYEKSINVETLENQANLETCKVKSFSKKLRL